MTDVFALSDLCTPWCVHVAATLRIADHLAAGVTGIDGFAAASGCDRGALLRVLRHLVGKGVFDEPEPERFALNDPARALLEPAVQLGLDLDGIGGRMASAWGSLLTAVRTGEPAYHEVFGRPFWADLDAHPQVAERFDALMGPAGHGIPDPGVLLDGDWAGVHTVVDVGGGTGALLAEILRAHPEVRGTLVDLPRTAARARAAFEAAGLDSRATVVGRSFFDPLPQGADLYLLKNVLADWPDAQATALLRRCAEAAGTGGRVIVLGGVTEGPAGTGGDLLMMVLVGGRERSLAEFHDLARAAGLAVSASGRLPSGRYAVECRPG
jgi:SAM-dependent methyltransferase